MKSEIKKELEDFIANGKRNKSRNIKLMTKNFTANAASYSRI